MFHVQTLDYNLPEVAISPIPRIPIIAATPDSMISKNRSAAAPNAIHNPAINRILFKVCTFSNSLNDFYHLKATDSTNSEHPTLPAGVLAVGLLTFYWLIRFRQLKNIFH